MNMNLCMLRITFLACLLMVVGGKSNNGDEGFSIPSSPEPTCDGRPLIVSEHSTTIRNCYDYSDLFKGIQCFAVMKINGLISEEVAIKGIKTFASQFPPDEVLYGIGITNKWGLKFGLIYDPHGKIVGIDWKTLRWGKPSKGVVHHRDVNQLTFIYPWKSVAETELVNHWCRFTALTGTKGFHLAYALKGQASGIQKTDSFRKGCGRVNEAMRNNADYYKHVSVFLSADEICFEQTDRYDVVLGDYDIKETYLNGDLVEAYMPKWECRLNWSLLFRL